MANKNLFSSHHRNLPAADTRNDAGGLAYRLSNRQALAQLAATGCFNQTFYVSAAEQLDTLRRLIDQEGDNVFLAKLAVYAREQAAMKDMPAAILAALSRRDPQLTHRVFDRVVDNGRVLRTFFQLIRSGQFGKKSLSSSLQRAFQKWLNAASVEKLLSASIGASPSLRDVFRLARPTPADNARRALFGWLVDKPLEKWAPAAESDLPPTIRSLASFRASASEDEQAAIAAELNVRWDLLADSARGPKVWKAIAKRMGPQALRMNLNTLQRHEVLKDAEMVRFVAERIADADEVRRSRQFPYQYLAAYLNVDAEIPPAIKSALHQAAEIACGNVPELPGPVIVGLDVSGSMSMAATGNRGRGATSSMRCVDVASLFAAAIVRRNPSSVVLPFDTVVHAADVDPGDTILSLAKRMAGYGGGGTNCALPLIEANTSLAHREFAGVILVSDNESWIGHGRHGSTGVLTEWEKLRARQRGGRFRDPKLVCIDVQPNTTTQAPERDDILNVGGFSDAVFRVVSGFLGGDASRFVAEVETVEL